MLSIHLNSFGPETNATMSNSEEVKKSYDEHATTYDEWGSVPLGILESQLLDAALGDCTGLTILDLGGGTGLRARQLMDAGAAAVDVVDLSPEMMNIGKELEAAQGRDGINWYEADVSKPLSHLPLGSYDIVMANWIFDHAASVEDLEGMWRNIAAHLKPGGRFVGVRCADPECPALAGGKYGSKYSDVEEIPGGIKARVTLAVNPPMEFESTSMKVNYSGSTELHEKYGMENVEVMPYLDTEVVAKDYEFWKEFLDRPGMAVVRARKRINETL